MERQRAVGRTLQTIAAGGAWFGHNAKVDLAKWFLSRCRKRDRKVKLERASRKRNRRK